MNPVFPEYLAVGGSDAFIRMYDRRKLKCNVIEWPENEDTMRAKQIYLKTRAHTDYDWSTQKYCQFFSAGHLAKATKTVGWRRDSYTSTYVTFSPNGRELLANMGSEQIYLFDVFHGKPVNKDSMQFNNFLKKCDTTSEDILPLLKFTIEL
jgi:WD and tetratricopeptide repeat-containing protein 1